MALQDTSTIPNESADNIFAVHKNAHANKTPKVWVFDAVAADETVPTLYPVGFNESTGNAGKWMAPDPTVAVINGGFTGGTWGLTINGIVIANTVLAWDATEDLVAATIKASTGVIVSVDLTAGVYTLTFDGEDEVTTLPTVAVDVTALTGGTPLATITAGTATYGLHKIKGVVWPEPIDLKAAGEVNGVCMYDGYVQYAEMAALVDAGDLTALQAACRTELLPRGLVVEELTQVR